MPLKYATLALGDLKIRRPALYAAASMRANTNASASSLDV
jgi:hypothetical protein